MILPYIETVFLRESREVAMVTADPNILDPLYIRKELLVVICIELEELMVVDVNIVIAPSTKTWRLQFPIISTLEPVEKLILLYFWFRVGSVPL